jgi:hypothetical protein
VGGAGDFAVADGLGVVGRLAGAVVPRGLAVPTGLADRDRGTGLPAAVGADADPGAGAGGGAAGDDAPPAVAADPSAVAAFPSAVAAVPSAVVVPPPVGAAGRAWALAWAGTECAAGAEFVAGAESLAGASAAGAEFLAGDVPGMTVATWSSARARILSAASSTCPIPANIARSTIAGASLMRSATCGIGMMISLR